MCRSGHVDLRRRGGRQGRREGGQRATITHASPLQVAEEDQARRHRSLHTFRVALWSAYRERLFHSVHRDTPHAAGLSSRPNKTDRSDARAIDETMRLGHFKPVHVKSRSSQLVRTTLIARQKFVDHMLAIELSIRGLLKVHGLKLGAAHRNMFAAKVEKLLADAPELRAAIEPLLEARNQSGSILRRPCGLSRAARLDDPYTSRRPLEAVCARHKLLRQRPQPRWAETPAFGQGGSVARRNSPAIGDPTEREAPHEGLYANESQIPNRCRLLRPDRTLPISAQPWHQWGARGRRVSTFESN